MAVPRVSRSSAAVHPATSLPTASALPCWQKLTRTVAVARDAALVPFASRGSASAPEDSQMSREAV